MARPLPSHLSELAHLGGVVRVKCRRCGREARFNTGNLADWFRSCGIRDDWKTIRRKFVCEGDFDSKGCGGRDVEVSFELEAPEPPKRPPAPPRRLPARDRSQGMGQGGQRGAEEDGAAAQELRGGGSRIYFVLAWR